LVKHTGLVNFSHCSEIFVSLIVVDAATGFAASNTAASAADDAAFSVAAADDEKKTLYVLSCIIGVVSFSG